MSTLADQIATVLAQVQGRPNPTPALIWAGVLIVCAMIGGVIVMQLRKKMLEAEQTRGASDSLMEQLRSMHASGEISDAEYEQTRKSIASRISHVMDTKRGGGLFELPDPKRRVSPRREMGIGPIAPPSEGSAGNAANPASGARVEGPDDLPPGYGAEGGSAKPDGPSP